MKRWRWTEHHVREVLKDEAAWGFEMREGPEGISQPPPNRIPTVSQPREGEPEESAENLPTTSQPPPNRLPTRVSTERGKRNEKEGGVSSPGSGAGTENARPGLAAEAETVWKFWRDQTYPDGTKPHARSRKLTKDDRPTVNGRLRKSSLEDILLVIEWAHSAETARFPYWGEKQCGLYTILKPRLWSERLEKAQAWEAAGKPRAGATTTPSPRPGATPPQGGPVEDFVAAYGRGGSNNWKRHLPDDADAHLSALRSTGMSARDLYEALGSQYTPGAKKSGLRAAYTEGFRAHIMPAAPPQERSADPPPDRGTVLPFARAAATVGGAR